MSVSMISCKVRSGVHVRYRFGFVSAALCAVLFLAIAVGRCDQQLHWAFGPPLKPPVPRLNGKFSSNGNPIDSFLLADLQKKGLSFSPEADRKTLIRRLTYDLIGLPPTPDEVRAFEADKRPDAYEQVVDRLLADTRYGERWARHWLDVAGYADSEGVLQEDLIRPNAYRYRDYVIKSFNEDKPYNGFLMEQIAGDELYDYRNAEKYTPEIEDALVATGFLRTAVDATRTDFNTHQFTEYQYRMLNDTEAIVASSVLGITLQCARCHDHKYEPFTQRDYFSLQACFAGAIRPEGKLLPSRLRQITGVGLAEQKHAKETNAAVDAALLEIARQEAAILREYRPRFLEAKIDKIPEAERQPLKAAVSAEETKRTPAQTALIAKYKDIAEAATDVVAAVFPEFKTKTDELKKRRSGEERKRVTLPEIRALYDQDLNPPTTHILARGEWTKPLAEVQPGVPTVLAGAAPMLPVLRPMAGAYTTGRRKALAEWIVRPDNPLTARVIVNRVWAHHFGVGIVPTLENFGRSGAKPTNQPLLDWLTCTFVETRKLGNSEIAKPSETYPNAQISNVSYSVGWSLKALHRLIVTSAAYRQSSALRTEAAKVDPENKLLWRQRSRRLEAEAIRDGMLAVAGNLDHKMYGEPVSEEVRATGEIAPVGEAKGGRRSIYLLVRRSMPVNMLTAFDTPVMETNCTRRTVSTTPIQALALMNSTFISTEASAFSARLLKEATPRGGTAQPIDADTVTRAYLLAFSRPPTASEKGLALDFLRAQLDRYRKSGKKAEEVVLLSYSDLCQALLSANEFAYFD